MRGPLIHAIVFQFEAELDHDDGLLPSAQPASRTYVRAHTNSPDHNTTSQQPQQRNKTRKSNGVAFEDLEHLLLETRSTKHQLFGHRGHLRDRIRQQYLPRVLTRATTEGGVRLLPRSYLKTWCLQRGNRKPATEMNVNGTAEGSQAMEVDPKFVEAAMAGGGTDSTIICHVGLDQVI